MLSFLLLCTDMRGRESWGGGCGREPMQDLPVEMSGPGLAHCQQGQISWMSPSLAVKPFFITSSPASYLAWLLTPCPPKAFPLSLEKRWADTLSCLFLLLLSFACTGLCSFTSLWQTLPSVPPQTFYVSELLSVGMEVKIQLEMIKSTASALSTPEDLSSVRHEREKAHKGIFSLSLSYEF